MIALYIVCGIFALILLILLLDVRVYIDNTSGEWSIILKYAFFKVILIPKQPTKIDIVKILWTRFKHDFLPEINISYVKDKIYEGSYSEALTEIDFRVRPILSSLGNAIHHIRFIPFKLNFTLAGKDAADLAIEYGKICAVFYPIFAFLCENMIFKNKNIYIGVDYVKPKSKITFYTVFKIRVIYAVCLVARMYFELIRVKAKRRMNYKKPIKVNNDKERTA